jgi:Tol biopolymer transport system component
MTRRRRPPQGRVLLALVSAGLLGSCAATPLRPLPAINQRLEQTGSARDPSLSGRWLALISGRNGRDQALLIDLDLNRPVPVPGLNRPDAQPLSVSVDAQGERLALVRQLDGRTELLLYRRSRQSLQPLPLSPAGVPRQARLSGDGRVLAVQVSRDGLWQVDLIELP